MANSMHGEGGGGRLNVAAVGRVVAKPEGWTVTDVAGVPIAVVDSFMRELRACGSSRATEKSYCFDLLRWLRFLTASDVPWEAATRDQVREFVLWLRQAENPQRVRSGQGGRPAAGSINERTYKQYLSPGYAPRTVNHALSVLMAFYDFAVRTDAGPLFNPVPPSSGGRSHDSSAGRRAAYRQRVPRTQPRDVTAAMLEELFDILGNDRDRALVAIALSSGVRASELLSMKIGSVDAGRCVFAVTPKGGAGTVVWVPAAPEAFVWVARYLADRAQHDGLDGPMWMTTRSPQRPLNYFAMRQVIERANTKMGTNLTWHDFRHTFVHRLLDDERMSLPQVQLLARHRSLSTLSTYANMRLPELVRQFHQHLSQPPPPVSTGTQIVYDAADLAVLFPGYQA